MKNLTVHHRLEARRERLGQLLALDEPTEVTAALQDLETLLVRCGYHVAFALHDRASLLSQRRGSRREPSPSISTRPRGRPPGSANWATRQLGLGLATIWAEYTGTKPTRRFDGYGDAGARGPYRDFVNCVLSALPKRLRPKRKGHIPDVDHLVRLSIQEHKDAQLAGNEARRRGLLEEHRWIGSDGAPASS